MHAEKRFDDSLSGTTSISVLFRGRTMYVSNVGDSRAIVVSVDSEDRYISIDTRDTRTCLTDLVSAVVGMVD